MRLRPSLCPRLLSLAAAVACDESLCEFEPGNIAVDTSTGATRFERAYGGPHEVAVSVRREAFFDNFFRVF